MRRILLLSSFVLLALAVGGAGPAPPSISAPIAAAALSCNDCINVCILRRCGFGPNPACAAAAAGPCRQQCASSCP
jgi:hypothetical protein